MKNTLIFIFIIFFLKIPFALGQIINIDEKNGFKELILGDSIKKWEGQLSIPIESKKGLVGYYYTGDCCKQMFEFNLKSICLFFKNDKLVLIELFTKDDYIGIHSHDYYHDTFIKYFGRPDDSGVKDKSEEGEFSFRWIGNKVIIDLIEAIGPTINGWRWAKVRIYDKKYLIESVNSGF
jgi:hypothetical protein